MLAEEHFEGSLSDEFLQVPASHIQSVSFRLQTLQHLQLPGFLQILHVEIDPQISTLRITKSRIQTDLQSYLGVHGPFDESEAKVFLLQISSALSEAEIYVSIIQNLSHGNLCPRTVFVHEANYVLSEPAAIPGTDSYWCDLRTLAALTVYTGCCATHQFEEVCTDSSAALLSLNWSEELKGVLRRMRGSKTLPSFGAVVRLLTPQQPNSCNHSLKPHNKESEWIQSSEESSERQRASAESFREEVKDEDTVKLREKTTKKFTKPFNVPPSLMVEDDIDYSKIQEPAVSEFFAYTQAPADKDLPPDPLLPSTTSYASSLPVITEFNETHSDLPSSRYDEGIFSNHTEVRDSIIPCTKCNKSSMKELFGCFICCYVCHLPLSLSGGRLVHRCGFCDENKEIELYEEKGGFFCQDCVILYRSG